MSISNIKELLSKRIMEEESGKSGNMNNDAPCKVTVYNTSETIKGMPTVCKSLTEEQAGITEFIYKGAAFIAILKHRFSDFHVNEIDLESCMVQLTSTDLPNETEVCDIGVSCLDTETLSEIDQLMECSKEEVVIDVTSSDKDKRRDIHKEIKRRYGPAVISNTSEEGESKKIIIKRMKDSKSREIRWPDGRGKFLHFVLHKSNLDTIDAVSILASKLKCKSSLISYAGTKDKRGKTSQWVCMKYLEPKRLKSVNNCLRDMVTGNYKFKNFGLKLGDLKGNYFQLVLRNVSAPDKDIIDALKSLKENGFINYFGLQRFGTCAAVPTYEIGKSLCKEDFKSSVELILNPRSDEGNSDLVAARKIWWETHDADKAFKSLKSKDRTIEGKLLLGLAKHGKTNYSNALKCIPRNIRLLYLHSYQSIVWNRVISRRIRTFGSKVLKGDLVKLNQEINNSNEQVMLKKEGSRLKKCDVKILTYDDVMHYNIMDIVYPLPGHDVIYPDNVVKDYYEEILKEDGMNFESFQQADLQYSLSGTYRSIMGSVKDLTYDITYYSDPEETLILSDLEKMNNVPELQLKSEGEYKALIVRFTLNSSSYATMVIREITHTDTSKGKQISFTNYHVKRNSDLEMTSDNAKKMKLETSEK